MNTPKQSCPADIYYHKIKMYHLQTFMLITSQCIYNQSSQYRSTGTYFDVLRIVSFQCLSKTGTISRAVSSGFMFQRSFASRGLRNPFHASASNHEKKSFERNEAVCSGQGLYKHFQNRYANYYIIYLVKLMVAKFMTCNNVCLSEILISVS